MHSTERNLCGQVLIVIYRFLGLYFLLLVGDTGQECSGRTSAVHGLPTAGILQGVYEGVCVVGVHMLEVYINSYSF